MISLKKRWIFSTVGALGAGTLAYMLKDEERRGQWKGKAQSLFSKAEGSDLPVEAAGNPQEDNHENTKMVSEGSQFGVQYYNELTEKEREILEKANS
ncbi:hypothetical protein [Thalassobacillus cyri]|uniref:hypothetical protein n=1 Tax=Thalassobacillus cyri TaxID=571932 RepID=UPI003183D8A5